MGLRLSAPVPPRCRRHTRATRPFVNELLRFLARSFFAPLALALSRPPALLLPTPAAEFAHPVEVILSNQVPTVGLVLGLGAHPLVQLAWIALRLAQTYEVGPRR